jgi:hypothetical protein
VAWAVQRRLPASSVSIFNRETREFEFQPDLVFVDVLLADEIDRATPRTQSALLEALRAVNSGEADAAIRGLERWDDLTRKLQAGVVLRRVGQEEP